MAADDRGFILLPLGAEVRAGHLPQWGARNLSLLVVLVSHENQQTRLAWPSLNRLAILAGVRKADVPAVLCSLASTGWMKPATGPGDRRAWKLLYPPYPGALEPRDWIRISRALVMQGAWADMTPSARSLYLVLLALAWVGRKADEEGEPDYEAAEDGLAEWATEVPYRFLPAAKLDPATLADLAGLEPRTERKARQWLLDHGLAVPTSEGQAPGLMLPHDPRLHAPAVLERLERDKAEAEVPKGAALRAFRAARKRTAQNERPYGSRRTAQPIATTGPVGTTNGPEGAGERPCGNEN